MPWAEANQWLRCHYGVQLVSVWARLKLRYLDLAGCLVQLSPTTVLFQERKPSLFVKSLSLSPIKERKTARDPRVVSTLQSQRCRLFALSDPQQSPKVVPKKTCVSTSKLITCYHFLIKESQTPRLNMLFIHGEGFQSTVIMSCPEKRATA